MERITRFMKIYLDNCCYNRPYDDQRQLRISLETQAKLSVQDSIRNGENELVSSFVLIYEISRSPNTTSAKSIEEFVERYTDLYVSENNLEKIEDIAESIQGTGVKKMDSWHIACAIIAGAEYFLTTDKRLLKYKTESIKIMNPIDFIFEKED